MNQAAALNAYKTVGIQSGLMDATPHQLVSMLLDGALDRIAAAKGAMARNDMARQGESLGRAIAIIDNLRASLDFQRGADIASNLASLYDYMERRLLEARSDSDPALLDEVSKLLREIRSGWEDIPAELRKP